MVWTGRTFSFSKESHSEKVVDEFSYIMYIHRPIHTHTPVYTITNIQNYQRKVTFVTVQS
jgi:hypothetical protein